MKEALAELSKHETRVRNIRKWYAKRVAALAEERDRKLFEEEKALSPTAARIKSASKDEERRVVSEIEEACAAEPDANPEPDWMNAEPPPLAPGSLIEVPEKQGKRARG